MVIETFEGRADSGETIWLDFDLVDTLIEAQRWADNVGEDVRVFDGDTLIAEVARIWESDDVKVA